MILQIVYLTRSTHGAMYIIKLSNCIRVSAFGSLVSIAQERKSRRPMLTQYVSQEATFIIWNLLLSRGLVRNIPYGTTILFSASMAVLLMYVKAGLHVNKNAEGKPRVETIISLLRYIVGQHEEKDYLYKHMNETANVVNNKYESSTSSNTYSLQNQFLMVYRNVINKIKRHDRQAICPHSSSCLHYILEGSTKSFMIGIGIQGALNLVLNVTKIIKNPTYITKLFLQRKFLSVPLTLMSFTGIFRNVCCSLRWTTGKDNAYHALVAGLLAGTTYSQFNNNVIVMYTLWKTLDIIYQGGKDAAYLPSVPYGHEIQFIISCTIISLGFIIFPNCIRPGYWKTIHDVSGGRFATINRSMLFPIGLDSVQQLETIMRTTNTTFGVKKLFG